jgi:hypothetical protein
MTLQVVTSLLGDRDTYRRGALRSSWKQFTASRFMDIAVWHRLRDYNRPDFHRHYEVVGVAVRPPLPASD